MAGKEKVNIRQLSKIMQISQVTLRDWISKGMPAERTERGYLCDVDEVFRWRESYLSEKKQQGSEYDKAKTERMFWLAKRARLDFEREEGLLVPAKAVEEAAFGKARLVRDSLMAIPSRLSALLAAENDRNKCHEMLDKEIRQALENLSGGAQ